MTLCRSLGRSGGPECGAAGGAIFWRGRTAVLNIPENYFVFSLTGRQLISAETAFHWRRCSPQLTFTQLI